jgi:hypothetical protein
MITTTTTALPVRVHSTRQAAQLLKAVATLSHVRPTGLSLGHAPGMRFGIGAASQAPRAFSTSPVNHLRDIFPAKDTPHIKTTKPAWPHPGYTREEMLAVEPAHREPRVLSDLLAWKLVRLARFWMDIFTGIKPEQQSDKKKPTTAVGASKPLTEAQWFIRFIFLESIAGVPGMVAGMVRHLNSLRRLKRDNGWIETLLEESYNERMHLLTFMKMCEPGWFMKVLLLGAQGVFFNGLFVAYLLSPRIVHRFVGYLEEEAVHTYTRVLRELDEGKLPKWNDPKFRIPDIAVQYWNMPEGNRTMKDLILYIRADEAGHRGVNHTFGNLNQVEDPNPFVSDFKDREPPKPALKPTGYERADVI